jgi:hypothetical protein
MNSRRLIRPSSEPPKPYHIVGRENVAVHCSKMRQLMTASGPDSEKLGASITSSLTLQQRR